MGVLHTVTDIGRQYTPITATDINRHITEIKDTLAAILTTVVGIDMVDISTSMEGIGTMEAGTNTPEEDIGEEAIEGVIIVDENDINSQCYIGARIIGDYSLVWRKIALIRD